MSDPHASAPAPRPITYTLERGEYAVRVYGPRVTCAVCEIRIRIEHPGTLTITPPAESTLDIERIGE